MIDLAPLYAHAARLKAFVVGHLNGDARKSVHPILAMHESRMESEREFRRYMLDSLAEEAEAVLLFVADGYDTLKALELARYMEREYYEFHGRDPSFRDKMRDARVAGMPKRKFRNNPVGWYLDGELRRAREVRAAT